MSYAECPEASCSEAEGCRALELVIEPRPRDLGGFEVRRVLPSSARRAIGPFVFFDHMGPAVFPPGEGLEVRPHPHIHLATITHLFEGQIVHRDSLGSCQAIEPGAINWMTAGRGIVHSERTAPAVREVESRLHGLQIWIALPREHEDVEPAFHHHPADSLPVTAGEGWRARVLVGAAFGVRSPVATFSEMLYAHLDLEAGVEPALPDRPAERALYVVDGEIALDDRVVEAGSMAVLAPGCEAAPRAGGAGASLALIGGAPLPERRHLWWNFVSSDPARIEQAKRDWREGRFPLVPGDEDERIPLPGDG